MAIFGRNKKESSSQVAVNRLRMIISHSRPAQDSKSEAQIKIFKQKLLQLVEEHFPDFQRQLDVTLEQVGDQEVVKVDVLLRGDN